MVKRVSFTSHTIASIPMKLRSVVIFLHFAISPLVACSMLSQSVPIFPISCIDVSHSDQVRVLMRSMGTQINHEVQSVAVDGKQRQGM